MAGRLASVPEFGEWDNLHPAMPPPPPPRNLYRDLIRNVAVSRGRYIRQSAHTGSSHSSSSCASSSHYPSNSSECSSGSASTAATAGFCAHDHELGKIALSMVRDGYARRKVNEFGSGGPDRAPLETWFFELDADWVLLRPELQDKSASSLRELVERWIRALTVIAISMTELVLVVTVDETLAVARFGKASMVQMLVFGDAIISALKEEKLRTLVDMYVCVSKASYRFTPLPIYLDAQTILDDMGRSLSREVVSLREAISGTLKEVRTLVQDDDSWAILIPRGRGEVHRNTRLMMDCITSMVKAEVSMWNTAQSHDGDNTTNLRGLIDDSVHYLKDLLLRKSEHCSDPSLRYLFLLNNFYSVAHLSEPRPGETWVLANECKKFRDSYIDVSWGHVLSCIPKPVFKDSRPNFSCGPVLFSIPKTCFSGSRQHRKETSFSLAKFESAFHETYQAQKFWKVPDPQLRDVLREAITKTVISDYRCHLKKHPELEKFVSGGSSSPDVLTEMLGELFEG